jgi:3-phenylpropionate/trans-cinnamate dioxygenase ferredoxin reductase component
MLQKIVIVGAGQAGAQAVTSLRAEGFSGSITMVGDEVFAPYQRPPLSKSYLMGTLERARLFLKPDSFYQDSGCELILNVPVRAIDRRSKVVQLADERVIDYDRLLLATGTRVRRIRCSGADLPGIYYLRNIADVDRLSAAFQPGRRLAIVGGGYIGLEVAAVAVKHGLDVTVFEALDRVMARAVSKPVSDFFEQVHRAAGVKLLLDTSVDAFAGHNRLESITADSKSFPVDIALVGIGVVPNLELARAAGLHCEDGIVVDQYCATADPSIFAAGDCTWHVGRDGVPLRLESVQNAIDQARHAAQAMAGKPQPYRAVPWFWSDQYDLKLQIAGLARPGDETIVRGDPISRKFAVFHLRNGAVAAVESVNAPSEYLVGRKLIADGVRLSAERLADRSVAIKNIV